MSFKEPGYGNAANKLFITVIIILLLTNLISLGSLYRQAQITKEYQIDIEETEEKMAELQFLQERNSKEKAIRYYSEQIKKLLSEHDLIFLAQEQWEYLITVNGEVLKQNTLYIQGDSAHIILAELLKDKEILPDDILEKGRITGNDPNDLLQDHCTIFTTIPYAAKVEESGQGRRVIYDFKDIPHGTVISLMLSPILTGRIWSDKEEQQWERRIEIIRR